MTGIPVAQLWFREDSGTRPNTNPVHAFMEDDPEALCKDARIVYYKCEVFQIPPDGSNVHEACQKVVNERNRT